MTPAPESEDRRADCVFCRIIMGSEKALLVLEDETTLAFLDHRPLAMGHTLLVPKAHHATISDLPVPEIPRLFGNARRLCGAAEAAFSADGSLMAVNNNVSQSVPHLHIHIVPRRKGDRYKGNLFFPRLRDLTEEDLATAQAALKAALGSPI